MMLNAWICVDSLEGKPVSSETCAKIIDLWVNKSPPFISRDFEGVVYEDCYLLYDTTERVLTVVHCRVKDGIESISATFRRDVSESVIESEDAVLSYLNWLYKDGYENLWYNLIGGNSSVNIPESVILDKYDSKLGLQILKSSKQTKVTVRTTLEYTEPKIEQFTTKCFQVYLNSVETDEFDDIFLKAQFYNIPLPDKIRIQTESYCDEPSISVIYLQGQKKYLKLIIPYTSNDIHDSLDYFYEKIVPQRSFFTVSGKTIQEIIPQLNRFGYREVKVSDNDKENAALSHEMYSFSIPKTSYVIKRTQEITLVE